MGKIKEVILAAVGIQPSEQTVTISSDTADQCESCRMIGTSTLCLLGTYGAGSIWMKRKNFKHPVGAVAAGVVFALGSYQLAYQRWFDTGFFDKELSMQEASKKDIISALDALHLPTPEILIAHSKTELDTSPNEKS